MGETAVAAFEQIQLRGGLGLSQWSIDIIGNQTDYGIAGATWNEDGWERFVSTLGGLGEIAGWTSVGALSLCAVGQVWACALAGPSGAVTLGSSLGQALVLCTRESQAACPASAGGFGLGAATYGVGLAFKRFMGGVQEAAVVLASLEVFSNLAPDSSSSNPPPGAGQAPYGISVFETGERKELGVVRFWRVTRR